MFPCWDMQTHDFFLIKKGKLQNSIYTSSTDSNVNCSVTVAQSCLTLYNPWTRAHQVPLSLGLSRQELQQVAISFSRGSPQSRD